MQRDFEDVQNERLLAIPLEGDAAAGRDAGLPVRPSTVRRSEARTGERAPDRVSLSGEWLLQDCRPIRLTPILASDGWPWRDVQSRGVVEGWHQPGTDRSSWRRVMVPTTVQRALVDLGELPDPMWDSNTYDELTRFGRPRRAAWHLRKTRVEQAEWWFVRTFTVPTRWRGESVRLRFDGVDYACSVYLNGFPLGYHEGLYGGPTFEVGKVLDFASENTVAVRIHPPSEDWRPSVKGSPGWGWHYGHMVSAGIWRDVTLEPIQQLEIRDLQVTTVGLAGNAADVRVDFTADVVGVGDLEVACVASVARINDSATLAAFEMAFIAPTGTSRHSMELHVDGIEPWWPVGMGPQTRYRLTVSAAAEPERVAVHSTSTTFGIRMVEMAGAPGQDLGLEYRWQFVINGQPVFVRGANWCWLDPYLGRDRDRYRHVLELTRRSGVMMLRAWGGGMVEGDDFYELCDELGLMVYQEFSFHGEGPRDAPGTDLGVVDRQVCQVVKRLRNHPSLVMWGGGNENEVPAGTDQVLLLVGRRCRQLDPGRPFHRTDPWAGSLHNWSVYHGGEPIDRGYGDRRATFYSEFGLPSMTSPASTQRYLPASATELWPPTDDSHGIIGHLHQFNRKDLVKTLRYCAYGPIRDWDTYAEFSQMAQGDALRFVAEMQRSRSGIDATGFWYYKMSDLFPGHSWGVVDWYGSPKLSYYRAKQACRPRSAFATYPRFDVGSEAMPVTIHAANDEPAFLSDARVEVSVFDARLATVSTHVFDEIVVPPYERRTLGAVNVPGVPPLGRPTLVAVSLVDRDGAMVSDNWYWFDFRANSAEVHAIESLGHGKADRLSTASDRWDFPDNMIDRAFSAYAAVDEAPLLGLPRTRLALDVSATFVTIRNTGTVPAFNVIIDGFPDGQGWYLEDNSFCLRADETRDIAYQSPAGRPDRVVVGAWNADPVGESSA